MAISDDVAAVRVSQDGQRIRLFAGMLVVLIFTGLALFKGEALLADPDTGWHIATGRWIWAHGALPSADPFSHTFAGEPWIAKEWLSQFLYFGAHALGGWNGVLIFTALAIASAAGALYWVLSEDMSPPYAAFACVLAMMLASTGFVARPHLLTLPLLVAWTAALFRAAAREEAPHFGLLLLIVLWSNLHGAFTLGFVIAVFAFIEVLEKRRRLDRVTWHWIGFLALCPLAAVVHPYGWQSLLATWTVYGSNEAAAMITEWQPFNARTDTLHEFALIGLVVASLISGFRLNIARACLLAVLLHLFLSHGRVAFYLFPVMAILVAPPLARQFPPLSAQAWLTRGRDVLERRIVSGFAPLITLCAGGALVLVLWAAVILRAQPPASLAVPAAIAFAKSSGMPGNVFNGYDFGGPLILNGIATFIDGRNDQLFRGGFTTAYMSGPHTEEGMREVLAKYAIGWTIFPPADPRVAILDRLPGWRRVFADEFAVVHQAEASPPQ